MKFLWPDILLLLLLVPLLVAAYIHVLRKKKKLALRYASLAIIKVALGPRNGMRRHIPPALFLLAMIVAIFAIARPTTTLTLPSEQMTLALAIDVSRSMQATDVSPDRISAAQAAAKAFIADIPKNVRLGIVSFAATAQIVQSPTENQEDMIAAISRFQLQRGTATGSGLMLALAMLFPDDGIDVEAAVFDGALSGRLRAQSLDAQRKPAAKKVKPVPVGSYKSGAIVLLSDGRRTSGPDPVEVAKMAVERGVRVFTVGFGTKDGAAANMGGYWSYYFTLDEEALKAVAKMTGGEYFHAGNANDLKLVYQNLSAKFTLERKETEVSSLFSAAAALFALIAVLLTLVWFYGRT